MKDFDKDYAFATLQIEKTVESMPSKLLIRESGFDKNLNKSSLSDTGKLKKIYKLQQELSDKIAPNTHCQKGCSHCCHYNVDILDIEAELISQTYGIQIKNPATLFEPQPTGNQRGNANFHGQVCGFLKDNQCSIYQARPFMCRKLASFMPDEHWCHSDINEEIDMPHIAFSEINLAYARLIEHHETRDIRQWFEQPAQINPTTQKAVDQIPVIEIH
ncbi:MAG: YkgJ family cysteine cluster protein [Pseudomonadales bacterium]|nr:YkgJ family cysteine cluster protein [Pseudomonadales bacterium]